MVTTDTRLLIVRDDVLPDAAAYRRWALTQPFQTFQTGDEVWQGIAPITEWTPLAAAIVAQVPGAIVDLTFFRRSPYQQPEPNFIHSDEGMASVSAILYLNPDPPPTDGTTFWRYKPTGAVAGSARDLEKAPGLWEPWHHVEAKLGRLLIFDSWYFHSRALPDNYGNGETARLIQVAFCSVPAGAC